MNWNRRLLCGISAAGDIFNFSGILLLITFHLITVAKPYFIFSHISCLRLETAIFVFSETWGAQLSDAMMCGIVQFGE